VHLLPWLNIIPLPSFSGPKDLPSAETLYLKLPPTSCVIFLSHILWLFDVLISLALQNLDVDKVSSFLSVAIFQTSPLLVSTTFYPSLWQSFTEPWITPLHF
jgi:hypothetical protein